MIANIYINLEFDFYSLKVLIIIVMMKFNHFNIILS